jgi:hypothetical protein
LLLLLDFFPPFQDILIAFCQSHVAKWVWDNTNF